MAGPGGGGWAFWAGGSRPDARRRAGRRPRGGRGAAECRRLLVALGARRRRGRGRRRADGGRLRAPDLPGGTDAELLPVTSPCDGRREFDTLEQRGVLEDRDQRARLRRLAGQLDALGVEGEHREPGVTGEDLGQLAKHGQGPDRELTDRKSTRLNSSH